MTGGSRCVWRESHRTMNEPEYETETSEQPGLKMRHRNGRRSLFSKEIKDKNSTSYRYIV